MNCPNCKSQNNESARFCRNCGANLDLCKDIKSTNNIDVKSSDNLLLVHIVITFLIFIIHTTLPWFASFWYQGIFKYAHGVTYIIGSLSFVLIPLAIKNKNLKIGGLIVSGLLIISWVYQNIHFMLA
ncbi:MAG: zinc ribbon domain-containing protein [Marinifilaceae bacterium]|jgi:hypothetical protein|nr:zinc ribbon domain-containing protein [Marinifilaceae bacterium]